jgi:hypothetical protein
VRERERQRGREVVRERQRGGEGERQTREGDRETDQMKILSGVRS